MIEEVVTEVKTLAESAREQAKLADAAATKLERALEYLKGQEAQNKEVK